MDVRGVDVLLRPDASIPVGHFDGTSLPLPARSFDAVLVIDVLHHAEDPFSLLREAARVSRGQILIKDHASDRVGSVLLLRFIDWVGNARHGVALRCRHWKSREWRQALDALGLKIESWENDLGLYPAPASWVVGGSLQFLAQVTCPAPSHAWRLTAEAPVELASVA